MPVPLPPRRLLRLGLPLLALVLAAAASAGEAPGDTRPKMTPGQAAVLGVVEGLTEYLPVSSTGHLILAQRAMGMGGSHGDRDAADAYAICIQLGAILAVAGLYRGYLRRMGKGLLGQDPEGRKLLVNTLTAFAPVAVIGLTAPKGIKTVLFGLWPVVVAWFVGGVAILVVSRWKRLHPKVHDYDLFELPWNRALVIGLIQCLAVWPGTSRSLVTIVGGMLVGMSLRSAVIFSFLLGMITLAASTAYDLHGFGDVVIETYGLVSPLTGLVVAFISAVAAVKWMVAYLKKHGMALFGYYRVALAAAVAALILSGVLDGS